MTESRKLLNSAGTQDMLLAGVSCCLPLENAESARQKSRRIVIIHLSLTAALLMSGLLLFGLGKNAKSVRPNHAKILGGSVFFVAILSMTAANFVGRLPARRAVMGRLRLNSIDSRGGRWVGIEDSSTYSKIKVVPEDIALMFLHPDLHCIQIEGFSHRYLIYGRDVTVLKPARSSASNATQIDFRIGECILSVVIIDQSVVDEAKRQLLHKHSGFQRIANSLGPIPDFSL